MLKNIKKVGEKISAHWRKLVWQLESIYYDTKHYFINCWLFRKSLSKTRSWDWQGGLYLLKDHFVMMEKLHSSSLTYTCNKKTARDLRIAIDLIDRINGLNTQNEWWEHNYEEWRKGLIKTDIGYILSSLKRGWTKKNDCVPSPESRGAWKLSTQVEAYHFEYLMKHLTKHWRGWWE